MTILLFISASVKKCVVESQSSIWKQCIVGNRCPSGAAGETRPSRSRLFLLLFLFMTHLWGTVGISGVYCSTVQILANLIWIDHFCPMVYAVSHKCTRYLRSFKLSISDELKCQIYKKKKKKEMFHIHLKVSTLDFWTGVPTNSHTLLVVLTFSTPMIYNLELIF